jgi:hypothetical protein
MGLTALQAHATVRVNSNNRRMQRAKGHTRQSRACRERSSYFNNMLALRIPLSTDYKADARLMAGLP